jgi:hypothetical protein
MKTRFQFIHFDEQVAKEPTIHPAYTCRNNKSGETLAEILWDSAWRCYIMRVRPYTIWSMGCLEDVQAFVQQLGGKG